MKGHICQVKHHPGEWYYCDYCGKKKNATSVHPGRKHLWSHSICLRTGPNGEQCTGDRWWWQDQKGRVLEVHGDFEFDPDDDPFEDI